MALPIRRPILIGGLGLTFGAWVLNTIDPSLTHMADTAVWGIAALGSGIWFLKFRQQTTLDLAPTATIDRTVVDQALAVVATRIEQLAEESGSIVDQAGSGTEEAIAKLRQKLAALAQATARKDIRLAVTGGQSVGKTTLLQLLRQQDLKTASLISMEQSTSPGVPSPDLSPASMSESLLAQASEDKVPETREPDTADLVLFVTTGDLRDSEYQGIEHLVKQGHRLVLIFNKQDQYLPTDRPVILQQLRDRVRGLVPGEDVIATSAQPGSVIVRQQQADGSIQERLDQPAADISALQGRLQEILNQQGQQLIFGTVIRQAKALNAEVQTELNRLRRFRTLPIIEQYQWIAAAAAFANPVPSLDLLATASVTTQLVVDLGAIYQQSFSIDQAKTVMSNLAEQMVKLGLVEVASQAIAPLLKSHALTYVAGGTLQGISAAYLTRLAGLSLVEYFEEQSLNLNPNSGTTAPLQLDRLVQKIKAVFQANQRSAFVQSLVQQGMSRLMLQRAPGEAVKLPTQVAPKQAVSDPLPVNLPMQQPAETSEL